MPFGDVNSSEFSMEGLGLDLGKKVTLESEELSDEEAMKARMKEFEQKKKKDHGFFSKHKKK